MFKYLSGISGATRRRNEPFTDESLNVFFRPSLYKDLQAVTGFVFYFNFAVIFKNFIEINYI